MYPKLFNELIEYLEHLPGVGNKTAQRYAFALLDGDETYLQELAAVLANLKDKIKPCPKCGFLSEEGHCPICESNHRDRSTIMVVSYPQDVIAIEKTQTYHGMYHILNGVISSSKGIYPEDINLNSLLERIDDSVKEVIIATSPTMDGETTALYIDKLLSKYEVEVTRLANGLPMGASLDYSDELTLIKAMNNRIKFEK